MRVLAIIPARAGSKGVPGKNKKMLNGKPLIHYTFEAAIDCNEIERVLVTTDDFDILNMNLEFPSLKFIERPRELAEDSTPTLPVLKHAINELAREGENYDLVCLLQPTNPFRPKGFIEQCICRFLEKKCDSLVSVLKVPHEFNPHWVFESDENGLLKIATGEKEIIPRRQLLPPAYYRDGSVYITTVENICKKDRILGEKLAFYESDPFYYVNIDTMEDWFKAEEKATKLGI